MPHRNKIFAKCDTCLHENLEQNYSDKFVHIKYDTKLWKHLLQWNIEHVSSCYIAIQIRWIDNICGARIPTTDTVSLIFISVWHTSFQRFALFLPHWCKFKPFESQCEQERCLQTISIYLTAFALTNWQWTDYD